MRYPWLRQFRIGRRLAASFLCVALIMLLGNAFTVWQFYKVKGEIDRFFAGDQELITILRFQIDLQAFHVRLNELADLKDKDRLVTESQALEKTLIDDANRSEALLKNTPRNAALNSEMELVVTAVKDSFPDDVAAIRGLAEAGDWEALQFRLIKQMLPLEAISGRLVGAVDADIASERQLAAAGIADAQKRMLLVFLLTGVCTLIAAGSLGAAITASITGPLEELERASAALAQGNFQSVVLTCGNDELSHLGNVFNNTLEKLEALYGDLSNRESKLRSSELELRELIEFVPLHMFVLKPDGAGLYANRAVLEYHGFTLEEWIEKGLDTSVVQARTVTTGGDELQSRLACGIAFETEMRVVGKEQRRRWFLTRYNPLCDESGNVVRWYAARTDIEESKRETQRAQDENLALREEVNLSMGSREILGSTDAIVRVLRDIGRVAPTDSTVLITGETGTGKELIARAIHQQSARSARAFIAVNCAAIPSGLISSELFGHEKGAFTGAIHRRLGRFEAANGGTIFLDEIGELPAEVQSSLLRVLQERAFERVGSNQPTQVDVRILAATNRDLRACVAGGTFREDLFYRLNVFPIHLPPLRERVEDIPMLVAYFVEKFASKVGKGISSIKRGTLERFQAYYWPGNIRELQNVVERAVLLCDGDSLSVDEAWFQQEPTSASNQPAIGLQSLGRIDAGHERELIEKALTESNGRISGPQGAAARLGIPRQTLESKMRRLGIGRFKVPS